MHDTWQNMSDICERNATAFLKKNELDMACFWHNASTAFYKRFLELPAEDIRGCRMVPKGERSKVLDY